MASIGEQFKAARESRGLSVAQVAEATRIKPTHVEALERDAFGVFASPIYTRGFIKLYAECVGLDPAPLLEAFRASGLPAPRPTLQAEELSRRGKPRSSGPAGRAPGAVLRDLQAVVHSWWGRLDPAHARVAGLVAVAVLVAVLAVAGVRGAVRAARARPRAEPRTERLRSRPSGEEGFPLIEPPPDPYVDSDSFGVREGGTP